MGSALPPPAPSSGSEGRRSRPPLYSLLGLVATIASLVLSASADAISHDPQCLRWRAAFLSMPVRTLVVGTPAGPDVQVSVKVAATEEARRAGFQCATSDEIERTAILFDFGAEVLRGFHMWNVPAPLDIAFAKASGRIFSILRMERGARETYGPMGRFRYALEARAGFFRDRGVGIGHALVLESTR